MYKKVLLVNPFGIGDVLFTTPIIHTLKDSFAGINIGYLCNRRTIDILESNPYIDHIFVYERDEFEELKKKSFSLWLKQSLAYLSQIKRERYDLAIDFSLNTQYGFFCWFAGIKERIGYDFKNRGRFLTKKIKLSGYSDKHVVEYYAELLAFLGINLRHRKLELYLKEDDFKKADDILNKQGITRADCLVCIIPGAGRSWGRDARLKHWPTNNFAHLADKLIENYHAEVIIMGDFSEKNIAEKLKDQMSHEAFDLTGKTSIRELAAILSRSKLLVTNDGGPLHIASAIGTKSVSIFGPVDETIYGPYPGSDKHIVIKKDLSCRPCYQKFRVPVCLRARECINSISVEEVFAAAKKLM